jgi:hypothetical protein
MVAAGCLPATWKKGRAILGKKGGVGDMLFRGRGGGRTKREGSTSQLARLLHKEKYKLESD